MRWFVRGSRSSLARVPTFPFQVRLVRWRRQCGHSRTRPPGVLIVDIALEGADGLELIKRVKARWADLPMLVLSMHSEDVYAERALRAGAHGCYIMKQEASQNVLTAIRRVMSGELYVSPRIQSRLLCRVVDGADEAPQSPVDTLSDRELEVFRLIGLGRTTREIASELTLSVKTIESHREHIKKKMQLAARLNSFNTPRNGCRREPRALLFATRY